MSSVIIRAGSHAEKEYFIQLARFMGGVSVGANLFEATPGATASLLLRVGAKTKRFYIDPMTYAYGAYADPRNNGAVRADLDWIKSDQTRKDADGNKYKERDFKRSYRKLAAAIGGPLDVAVQNGVAVSPETQFDIDEFCGSVCHYQLNRVREEFERNPELKDVVENAPTPSAVFAPYFYIEPSATEAWYKFNLQLMTAAAKQNSPVHGIVCADQSHLASTSFRERLVADLPATGLAGVWFWFSGFYEDIPNKAVLTGYRDLVNALSDKMEVYAMRGGFFSLALSKFGLSGIGHGVGYGEQKGVVPVIGQSVPMVRYYLPPLKKRLSVADIQLAMTGLEIDSPEKFHNEVCNCAVCRGVVVDSIDDFRVFGDTHFSRADATRPSQTPAAAKRCRYHFLLSRIKECEWVKEKTAAEIAAALRAAADKWKMLDTEHLTAWADVLG